MFDIKVGLLKGKAYVTVDPEAKPVQLPPWAVLQNILPKLKEKLHKTKWEQKGSSDHVWRQLSGSTISSYEPRRQDHFASVKIQRISTSTLSRKNTSQLAGKIPIFATLDTKSGYWTKDAAFMLMM